MNKTWKVSIGFILIVFIFLLSFVNASESVSVTILKDGQGIDSVNVGDVLTLHSELRNATEGDTVTFTVQPEQLDLIDAPGSSEITVPLVDNQGTWVAETQVGVKSAGEIQVSGVADTGDQQTAVTAYQLPESISITTTDEFVPGEKITLTAETNPSGSIDQTVLDSIQWSFDSEAITSESELKGQTISITIPEDLQSLTATASLPENNISNQITLTEQPISEDLLEIVSSDNSPGVLKGDTIIFTAETFSENSVTLTNFSWNATINGESIEGEADGNTYTIKPETSGDLVLTCSATTDTNQNLTAETSKKVVDQEIPLESVEIVPSVENDLQVGQTVEFSTKYQPDNATNIEGATFIWRVFENDQPVDTGETTDTLTLSPESTGSLSVTLDVTPLNADTITSNTVTRNVTVTNPNETQLKLISAKIVPLTDTSNLVAGDNVLLAPEISTEGAEGEYSYIWTAKTGNEIIANSTNEQFEFSYGQSAFVTVQLQVSINGGTGEFQNIQTEYYLTFLPSQEQASQVKAVLDNIKEVENKDSATDTSNTKQSDQLEESSEVTTTPSAEEQNSISSEILSSGETALQNLSAPLLSRTGVINPINNTEFTLGEILLGLLLILVLIITLVFIIIKIMRRNRKLFY